MIRRIVASSLAFTFATAFTFAQSPGNAKNEFLLIKAGRLIDTRAGAVLTNQAILIEGDRIKEVGPAPTVTAHAPAGARIIDLGGATVLPGLIDCHTHVTAQPANYYDDLFRKSPIDQAVVAHVYARRTVEAGFTTIRDVGAGEFIDVALRNAINAGTVIGPRMQVATLTVGATGGHGDISGFSPYLKFGQFSGIADGVDEIRKLIRFEIKNGADLIKLLATAGVLSEEESVGAPQFSQEEMNAVVQEAAMWGKKVAAHAHGAEGIKRAVRAGVASIEHGSLLDDEGIRMMKERGTYLVADIYNDDYIIAEYKRLGYPDKIIEKERLVGRLQRENFQRAVKAGVKIAFGTDAGVYPHGWNAKQFAHMVKWGLSPMQALQAATVNAADLLSWSDRIGVLETGKFADIIAVIGDPLADVSVMERVGFVMKGGEIIKDNLSQPAGASR
ncbi:MAG TPA: amidohydrolase family protein [Blastocatellia bacterium]|jgi:imidazolonepropionase-like amidohydrolase|nr:amidohydrolase family protein [Blastocatellia bacterium]